MAENYRNSLPSFKMIHLFVILIFFLVLFCPWLIILHIIFEVSLNSHACMHAIYNIPDWSCLYLLCCWLIMAIFEWFPVSLTDHACVATWCTPGWSCQFIFRFGPLLCLPAMLSCKYSCMAKFEVGSEICTG